MRRVMVAAALIATACTATSRPAPGPAPAPVPTSSSHRLADWPTYHGTSDRAGATTAGLGSQLGRAWSTRLDAALYAQPLLADGLVVAATENDTVYALDPATGHVRWRRHLAEPARRSDLPCGNIDPSGITGTPAYDAGTHLVFVATEDRDAHHTLAALDVRAGTVRWQRSLDVVPGRDRHAEQQRGALLVAHGRVYVPFGGRLGDCGNYVGYVAGLRSDGRGPALHYAVPTAREAGMWAAPGPVLAPDGSLYVASGNGAEVGGRYDGSDSVLRLASDLRRTALFAPSTWRQDNEQDLDLGSMSPALVGDRVVIAGKRGTVYLLRSDLGGIGGQLATLDGCAGYGGAAVSGSVVVLPCSSGVRALRVEGDRMRWLWHDPGMAGSPVVAGRTVLGFAGSDLVAVDAATGRRTGKVHVGDVTRFTTPVPAPPAVYVGTSGGDVVAVTAR